LSDLLLQGLTISAIGISLTFAALGILILMMLLLVRLFPVKQEKIDISRPVQPIKSDASRRSVKEEEIAAAIVAALSYFRARDLERSGLGETLERPPAPWWVMGQARQRRKTVNYPNL